MISKLKTKLYNFLRWSEKYTKTDMVYLAHGGFWLSSGYIITLIKGFVISILMANLLTKENYGYYKFILSIFATISIFGLQGLSTAITQSVAINNDGIVKKTIKTALKWSWIGSVFLLIFAFYYFTKNNLTFTLSFLVLAISFPLYSISGYYGAILAGKKKFNIQTKYYSIYSLISFLALALAIIISKNVFWIVFAFIASDIIVGNIFNLKVKKFLKNKSIEKNSINYGIKLSAINLMGAIAQNIDKVILPILLSYQDLAVYSIALVIPEQIKNLFKNILPLTMPKFASTNINYESKQKIFSYILKIAVLIIPLIIIYWYLAEFIFKLIYPQYAESVAYSKIFSLSLLTIPTILIDSLFYAKKKTKIIFKNNFINSISQIIITILLTYYYGLWGLIIARLSSRFINATYKIYLFKTNNKY